MSNLAVFELPQVEVRAEAVECVRTWIKDGFYKISEVDRFQKLRDLNALLSTHHMIPVATLYLGRSNCYDPTNRVIYLENSSIISFLHEYRHHMQHSGSDRFEGLTIEQDARAWSLRVFSDAVPKMFEKAVKAGKVLHVKWDAGLNKVVDNASYI